MSRPARICIFCVRPFREKVPEHFILESQGGRRASSDLDCPSCNHEFGNNLDRSFSRSFDSIKNLLQIVRQSGKPTPTLRNVELGVSGKRLTLSGSGRLRSGTIQIKSPEYPVVDGKRKIELTFEYIADLEKNFDHVCKANRISPKQLVEALRKGQAFDTATYTDEVAKFVFHVDEDVGRRSAAKTLLLYLADRIGPLTVIRNEFSRVREFARYGKGVRWEITDWRPDLRKPLGSPLNEGGANHWMAVFRSTQDGPITGVLCLFGFWTVQVDLATSSPGPTFGHLHDLDPLSGHCVDVTFDPSDPEQRERLEGPVHPNLQETFIRNFESLLALAWTRSRDRAVTELVERTFRDVLGPKYNEDDPIAPEKWEELSRKIGFRLSHHIMRLSFREEHDLSVFLDRKEQELRSNGLWS